MISLIPHYFQLCDNKQNYSLTIENGKQNITYGCNIFGNIKFVDKVLTCRMSKHPCK